MWSRPYYILIGALVASSTALSVAVRGDGPLPGEVATARWMHEHPPAAVDLFAGFIDPVLTDTAAPVVVVAITLLVWWRWGRYPAVLLGLAGVCTGLTRLGDLVERPRPTPTVEWSGYSFGNGGYPSGHVVFSVLVLGTGAVLARRHATPRIAMWIVGSMQLLIAVTSWTRVSRLEHWPLDVMGGGLMAAVGLLGIIWLHPRLAAMRSRTASIALKGRIITLNSVIRPLSSQVMMSTPFTWMPPIVVSNSRTAWLPSRTFFV